MKEIHICKNCKHCYNLYSDYYECRGIKYKINLIDGHLIYPDCEDIRREETGWFYKNETELTDDKRTCEFYEDSTFTKLRNKLKNKLRNIFKHG